MILLTGLVIYTGAAYVYDVLWRPEVAARRAREEADSLGKPLLVVGAGTGWSSLRALLFGSQLVGDINVDLAAPDGSVCGRGRVCHGDVLDLPFEDKAFGAALCTHVLEHVIDPDKALQELVRVADTVFIVTPRWWAPHTWLHPGHLWFLAQDGTRIPLWR